MTTDRLCDYTKNTWNVRDHTYCYNNEHHIAANWHLLDGRTAKRQKQTRRHARPNPHACSSQRRRHLLVQGGVHPHVKGICLKPILVRR